MKSTIIIPSYQPSNTLITVVSNLVKVTDRQIIVVDDGSGEDYDDKFNAVENLGATVVRYPKNKGKGFALKTAFDYQLKHLPQARGAVTADGDGQHDTEDILKIARTVDMTETPELSLGVRSFDKKTTPTKSYYGNLITSKVFKLATGLKVEDTQTGLRGFPKKIIPQMLTVSGQRFEYEMNMLTDLKDLKIELKQIPIQTIYEDGNSATHFHPVRDSLLVYKRFIKFGLSSAVSSLIDVGSFALILSFMSGNHDSLALLIATILARLISGAFNFSINNKLVFKSNRKNNLINYAKLFFIQLTASYVLLQLIDTFIPHPVPVKVFVDIMLFVASYFIQKHLVFKKEKINA
ncbi:MAG: bifunctional glycosyltransferase family 2/GtrA family protein [Lactobacillaceae bacterium]|jgi:glycosyltransferase involved in cell wall biosynthesis|nr:bifunctional glycosyltransferase family 2/GtrA family protein [Lactobacillaceae bacterium]